MRNQINLRTMTREQKGMIIAKTFRIVKTDKGWKVPSQSGHGFYLVKFNGHEPECNCPDCELRKLKCKHIFAVEFFLKKEIDKEGKLTEIKAVKITYTQDWKAYNTAQTHEKEMFLKLLSDLCKDIPNKTYGFGRPTLPLADMIFASALKVYTTFSCSRFVSDMREARENKYTNSVCSYSTVSNYMRNPELTPVLTELVEKSARPLKEVETDFAVDSSGFGTSKFDRWYSFKYGKDIESRIWVKAHLMNGVKTHIITGIKITEAYSHDSKEFSELVKETAKTFKISEVSADKAYSSRDNFETVASYGGTALIPFRSNATGTSRGSKLWNRMFYYFMYKHEEFLEHYHKRSNVETVFHMIKTKFGDFVRSKEWAAQINEVLLKVLCHNICVVIQEMHELGIKAEF